MLAHFSVAMDQTPAPLPPVDAPASAFDALRATAFAGDREARGELQGAHPQVWRCDPPDLPALEKLAAARPSDSLKLGSSSTVLRIPFPVGGHAVLKHYLPTKRMDPRDRLGRSKAMRSLLAAESLLRRGFDVARPLGAWSTPGKGSFLLLEDLHEHLPMHEAVLQVKGTARAEMLATVASLIRCLHRAGVAYRDLKPSNLLVRLPGTQVADYRFLDHDRNRFSRDEVPEEIALRDLAAFHAGLPPEVRASERMRSLEVYAPDIRERGTWQRMVPPIVEEARDRAHRWEARGLLGGRGG
ncbi:MAG: lipopolysaccharide kinase InaA family protein [Planctomycetota bacterium]|jgi:tRNA A-37 threonylcarbamoyl transferase component Bud32